MISRHVIPLKGFSMSLAKRRLLITSALPYANGDIHIGHLVEHITTDIWARFQKMRGHECLAICADDTHGAPIMVEARRQNVEPEALVAGMRQQHIDDLAAFEVVYDNYSSTNSELNRTLCHEIFFKTRTGRPHPHKAYQADLL